MPPPCAVEVALSSSDTLAWPAAASKESARSGAAAFTSAWIRACTMWLGSRSTNKVTVEAPLASA